MTTTAARPPCRDCGKDRPLMRDGRCPHCHETHRWAGKPKDFLPSANDFDEMALVERYAMTATQQRPTEAPTLLPGPVNGWTGRHKACTGCGTRSKMEIEDGLCIDCYGEEFGALGLAAAGRRKQAEPQATIVAPSPAPASAAPPAMPPRDAPVARPWHKDYPACLDCGSTEYRYASRGVCTKCYPAVLRPGYVGNAAPPKGPGGRDLVPSPPAPESPPAGAAPPVAEEVAPDRDPAPVPAETRVPTAVASAIVAEAQSIFDAKPDLEDIPLADLLAEVQRRAAALEVRASAAEGEAAKFRQILAVIG